jgi:hypothetical protein
MTRAAFVGFLGLALVACGGGGSDESNPTTLTRASGQGTVDGRAFTLAYGASQVMESGTVNSVLSDQSLGCDAFEMTNPPDAGYWVQVQVAKAELGVASRNMVMFSDFAHNLLRAGSSTGTVEVTELSDAVIALKIAYADTIQGVAYTLDGEFGVSRCP